MSVSPSPAARSIRWILPILCLAAAGFLPFLTGPYPLAVARSVLTYMALAMSWDLLLRSGQISFGIAGFFGIGAYAAALSALHAGFSPIASILAAGVIAAAAACILGFVILRLRAVYFAITTLALAEIFRVIMQNGAEVSGGPEGLIMPGLIFNGEAKALYWTSLAAVVVAGLVSAFFQRSRVRFALTAIRNNELAARSSGIHTFTWLLVAFVASSFIQGLVGGIQLQGYGFVSPDSVFDSYYTLLPLAMALLGGTYSTAGPVLGALLLGVSAEYLKLRIPYGHLVVYGIIIVLVILLMPQGLYGVYRARVKAFAGSRGGGHG